MDRYDFERLCSKWRAIGKDTNRYESLMCLGVILLELGCLKEAETRLLRSQELYEYRRFVQGAGVGMENVRIAYYLAKCRRERGKPRKGYEILKRLVDGSIAKKKQDSLGMSEKLAAELEESERLVRGGKLNNAFAKKKQDSLRTSEKLAAELEESERLVRGGKLNNAFEILEKAVLEEILCLRPGVPAGAAP